MEIILNGKSIEGTDVEVKEINGQTQLSFHFQVTSEAYHDVTVLLYENDFHVIVPKKELDFHAAIGKYSTSVTNLYKEGEVGDFFLTLNEK